MKNIEAIQSAIATFQVELEQVKAQYVMNAQKAMYARLDRNHGDAVVALERIELALNYDARDALHTTYREWLGAIDKNGHIVIPGAVSFSGMDEHVDTGMLEPFES